MNWIPQRISKSISCLSQFMWDTSLSWLLQTTEDQPLFEITCPENDLTYPRSQRKKEEALTLLLTTFFPVPCFSHSLFVFPPFLFPSAISTTLFVLSSLNLPSRIPFVEMESSFCHLPLLELPFLTILHF